MASETIIATSLLPYPVEYIDKASLLIRHLPPPPSTSLAIAFKHCSHRLNFEVSLADINA